MDMPEYRTRPASCPGADSSEDGVRISLMRREDVPAVARMEREYYSLPWSEQAFLDALDRDSYLFLKAEAAEAVAGYCGYLRSFEIAEITNVTVHRKYRRRHIARELLRSLMSMGRSAGIERFTLEVRRSNTGAIALYRSLGFCQEGIRRGYYEAPREDALILWTPDPAGIKE